MECLTGRSACGYRGNAGGQVTREDHTTAGPGSGAGGGLTANPEAPPSSDAALGRVMGRMHELQARIESLARESQTARRQLRDVAGV